MSNTSIINIIKPSDPVYKTWVYNKIDNEMLSKIVGSEEAAELVDDGWRLSPAEFTDQEEFTDSPTFIAVADDLSQKLNFLLNIDKCEDLMALREFATDFLQLKVHHKAGVNKIRKQIIEKATELNLFEDE